MLIMAVARSSSGRVTKSQGGGAILGVFFSTDNALYSIAFGTHTKTAEPIVGLVRKKHVPDKPNTPNNCEFVVGSNLCLST